MKKLFARLMIVPALVVMMVATAAPAMAQDHGGSAGSGAGTDVWEVAIWSLIAIGVFCLALGILYLFKKQMGGFPEHPSWVAPISIQRSRDLPSEPDAHGHDDHGDGHGHAPAH